MKKAEKEMINALKERARKAAAETQTNKSKGRKRGGYDAEELKAHWLEEFNAPTTRSKKHAQILKDKFYADHTITVMAIYSRIWSWSRDNAKEQGVEVTAA